MSDGIGGLVFALSAWSLSTLEQAPTVSRGERSMGISGEGEKLVGIGATNLDSADLLALSALFPPVLEQAPTAPWGGSIFGLRSGDKVTENWAGLQGGTVAPFAPFLSILMHP